MLAAVGDGAGFRTGQLQQLVVEPIEEGQLEDESGYHILAGERQQAPRHLIRMERRVIVHAVGISFQHLPQIGREVAFILGIDRFPDSEEAHEVVGDGGFRSLARGELAADRQRHLLDGGEIVFGMREGHAECDIRVPGADDVRHAEVVALDPHAILRSLGDQAGRIGRRGLA